MFMSMLCKTACGFCMCLGNVGELNDPGGLLGMRTSIHGVLDDGGCGVLVGMLIPLSNESFPPLYLACLIRLARSCYIYSSRNRSISLASLSSC